MPQITIQFDSKWITVAIAAAGAAAVLYRAHSIKSTTIWWIRKHKRYVHAASKCNDLIVITDFDATITSGNSEQCHDLIGFSKLMSPAFREAFAPLLDWTTNASIDGVEWWDRAHACMIQHGMPPRQIIPRLVREAKMNPRPGSLELLRKCEQLHIPVLIVSAGVTDVIEEFLRQHGVWSENVTICSNRLNYEADSTPKSVSPDPPITSFTKMYAYKSASSFFKQHSERRALIVLGDSVTDIDASENVPSDRVLSVGFVNERPDAAKHAQAYDAIVQGDYGSLQPVIEIIEEMSPSAVRRSISKLNLARSSAAAEAAEAAEAAAPAAVRKDGSIALKK